MTDLVSVPGLEKQVPAHLANRYLRIYYRSKKVFDELDPADEIYMITRKKPWKKARPLTERKIHEDW